MREGEMLHIQVPASTANLGPGFDSVGLAFNRYLHLYVTPSHEWNVVPQSREVALIPRGRDNLMIQVAEQIALKYKATLPPCEVKVISDIPMTRGLGSSASAIVAGIELADAVCDLRLSREEKMNFASTLEGHPDNVGPSIYGGLIVGSQHGNETMLVHVPSVNVRVAAVIPPYELKTSESRGVLPEQFTRGQAVTASAVSNVLVAAVMTNNWALAGEMMERDLFHQPYRAALVPELERVLRIAKQHGAYGAALSGAGPTVLAFASDDVIEPLLAELSEQFSDCEVCELTVDTEGAFVETIAVEKEVR